MHSEVMTLNSIKLCLGQYIEVVFHLVDDELTESLYPRANDD